MSWWKRRDGVSCSIFFWFLYCWWPYCGTAAFGVLVNLGQSDACYPVLAFYSRLPSLCALLLAPAHLRRVVQQDACVG